MKIGMLTSGGDCQALNAAMRGVVKGLSENDKDLEVYGFYEGYKGLSMEITACCQARIFRYPYGGRNDLRIIQTAFQTDADSG